VAARGNGLTIAPPPPITQGLSHGVRSFQWFGYESWPKNDSVELYPDSGTKCIKEYKLW
jgi:hypothetical protein